MVALLAIGLLLLLPELRRMKRIQRDTQELSRMMAVRLIVSSALSDYYETNGSFPRSLEDLPAGQLRWGEEGSSAADFKLLQYHSASNTFTLLWERGTNLHLFSGGRAGLLYWNKEDFNDPLKLKH